MNNIKQKSRGHISPHDWKTYDDESDILYSYIKKKGKHKRAKKDSKLK